MNKFGGDYTWIRHARTWPDEQIKPSKPKVYKIVTALGGDYTWIRHARTWPDEQIKLSRPTKVYKTLQHYYIYSIKIGLKCRGK